MDRSAWRPEQRRSEPIAGSGSWEGSWRREHDDMVRLGATDHAPDPSKPGGGEIKRLYGLRGASSGCAPTCLSFVK